MTALCPQFTPGCRAHRALDLLAIAGAAVAMSDLRVALRVNPRSKKAKSKLWLALYALEENGFLARYACPDEPRYSLTEPGRQALAILDQGREVFGLPHHERSRPPQGAPSVRVFARAA